jgi:hypothetical protein
LAESDGSLLSNRYVGRWSAAVTWTDVMAGDFDGDGLLDIAGRATENGEWWVAVNEEDRFVNSFRGRWSAAVEWTEVSSGDFDGDGLLDIIGRARGREWWLARNDGQRLRNAFWGSWSDTDWHDILPGVFDVSG